MPLQGGIYQRLAALNAEHGITVITIEHHAEFIARYARSVVLMADGALTWHLPVAEAFARSAELEAHGIPRRRRCRQCGRWGWMGRREQWRRPRMRYGRFWVTRPLGPIWVRRHTRHRVRVRTCPPPGDHSESDGHANGPSAVVSARGVQHAYRSVSGKLEPVLRGIDLELHAGERIALVGSNGSEKTTLLRMLAGLAVPREGRIVVDGVDTRSASPAVLADHVAYLLQHPQQMFVTDSVRSDVALSPTRTPSRWNSSPGMRSSPPASRAWTPRSAPSTGNFWTR